MVRPSQHRWVRQTRAFIGKFKNYPRNKLAHSLYYSWDKDYCIESHFKALFEGINQSCALDTQADFLQSCFTQRISPKFAGAYWVGHQKKWLREICSEMFSTMVIDNWNNRYFFFRLTGCSFEVVRVIRKVSLDPSPILRKYCKYFSHYLDDWDYWNAIRKNIYDMMYNCVMFFDPNWNSLKKNFSLSVPTHNLLMMYFCAKIAVALEQKRWAIPILKQLGFNGQAWLETAWKPPNGCMVRRHLRAFKDN